MISRSEHTSNLAALRVRIGDRDVLLTPGSYLVGRGPECHVQIESTRVSRRHAQINVGEGGATIQDLGSANGVFVAGQSVGLDPMRLEPGARVLIAGIEIQVSYEKALDLPRETPRLRTTFARSSELDAAASSSTHTTDFLELMSKIVERMLSEGRTDEAVSILQARLELVLQEARAGHVQSFDQVRTALRHGLLLAERTKSPRWVGYVLELLTLFHELPDELEAQRLEAAIRRSPGMDAQATDAYAEALKQIADPIRRMRGMQHARAFQRAVLAARR